MCAHIADISHSFFTLLLIYNFTDEITTKNVNKASVPYREESTRLIFIHEVTLFWYTLPR